MENNIEIIIEKKTFLSYFILYALINALLLYYIHDIIITDPQYFTGGNLNSVTLFRTLWKFVYFLSPFYEFIKILIISTLIYQAIKYFKKIKPQLWTIVFVVLLAQLILLIPNLLELVWFTFIKTNYTMKDVDYFNPLSIVNLINTDDISNFVYKLLSVISFFNLLYWCMLIYLTMKYIRLNFRDSLIVILSFYGSGAFIITILRLFLVYKTS